MGQWGYYDYPSTPPDNGWWQEMAEQESMSEFIEQEMSYEASNHYYPSGADEESFEDAMAECEEVASDEGGWGAWMGGEI